MTSTLRPPIQDPIRNPAWTLHKGEYVAEMSTLSAHSVHASAVLDPWNRTLRPFTTMQAHRDADGDVMFWDGATTVRGQTVRLMIFND